MSDEWGRYFIPRTRQIDDCLVWSFSTDTRGYGHLRLKVSGRWKTIRAHRYSWELSNGPIPEGLCVLHRCDVRVCVNPKHLFLGTYKDNRQDCIKKKRAPIFYGSRNPNSIISEADVVAIREALKGGNTAREVARRFKMSRVQILKIKQKVAWRHI